MVAENLVNLIGFGAFSIIFLVALIASAIEFLGKIYGTFRCLSRQDITSEQRIIYLVIIWFIPLGWLIYLLLGTERTQQLFSEVEFL